MTVVITPPSVAEALSVVLTPAGGVPLELVGGDDGFGIFLSSDGNDGLFAPPTYDEEYAQSADTEGGPRVRSTPQDITRQGQVHISAEDPDQFDSLLRTWQETIEAVRRRGGTLVFTDQGGSSVTYEVLSAYMTSFPLDGVLARQQYVSAQFSYVCKPYGLLDPVAVVEDEDLSGPLDEVVIDAPGGSVDALCELIFTDDAGVARDHLEIGVQDDYEDSVDQPLLFVAGDGELDTSELAGVSSTQVGAYGSGEATRSAGLFTGPLAICALRGLAHVGRFRVRARVYGSGAGTVFVRGAMRIGNGRLAAGPWVDLPALSRWYDLDLGLARFPAAVGGAQSSEVRIEAYSQTPGDVLHVNLAELIPAGRYAKARASKVVSAADALTIADSFGGGGGGGGGGSTLEWGTGTWGEDTWG